MSHSQPLIYKLAISSLVIIASLIANFSHKTAAQREVTWPDIKLTPLTGGLSLPVHVAHAGDGSNRLFIVEQAGRIRVYRNGLLPTPFLDISARVRSPVSGGGPEEGMLSAAFPPGFGSNKLHFYVYYTNHNGDNQVSRFFISQDPARADPDSEQVIIKFPHPSQNNHNGGQLVFGPDGYLYIGTGDGGGGGDPFNNAQDPASLLGKLLRIDVENENPPPIATSNAIFLPLVQNSDAAHYFTYQIPPGNPFIGAAGFRPEIWALGLRNPWRFSFDRQTGDLYTGDVGQNKWEEVDYQPAGQGGANYGWSVFEGLECFKLPCDPTGMQPPIYVYSHGNGDCSVTGGFVYRGVAYPSIQGIYFFADFCTGKLMGLKQEAGTWIFNQFILSGPAVTNLSSFGEDEAGELYLVSLSNQLYRLEAITP